MRRKKGAESKTDDAAWKNASRSFLVAIRSISTSSHPSCRRKCWRFSLPPWTSKRSGEERTSRQATRHADGMKIVTIFDIQDNLMPR
eukprot:748300-Hanusia_phi.AAC.2